MKSKFWKGTQKLQESQNWSLRMRKYFIKIAKSGNTNSSNKTSNKILAIKVAILTWTSGNQNCKSVVFLLVYSFQNDQIKKSFNSKDQK